MHEIVVAGAAMVVVVDTQEEGPDARTNGPASGSVKYV